MPVAELAQWAEDVALERPQAEELQNKWRAPGNKWRSVGGVSTLFESLARVMNASAWRVRLVC